MNNKRCPECNQLKPKHGWLITRPKEWKSHLVVCKDCGIKHQTKGDLVASYNAYEEAYHA